MKNLKKYLKEIAVILFSMIILISFIFFNIDKITPGYDVGTPPCDIICYNSTDCTDALNNASVDYVCLNNSVSDIAGTFINDPVNFTDKTFDCQNYIIDGDDTDTDNGIYLDGKYNNTIRNCTITDFKYGIRLYNSADNNNLTNNTLNSNTAAGVLIDFSSINNILTNNTFNSNDVYGVFLFSSANNNILNSNIICSNDASDIFVSGSTGN